MIPWFQFISFSIGPLTIQVWGLMLSLAFLASLIVVYQEIKRKGLDKNLILDLAIWIIVGALIGARFLYVLNEWGQFKNHWLDIFKLWEGGMALYGGVILGALAGYFFIRKKKLAFWSYADAVAFVLPLGLFVGRIGCFLIHDHLGRITTMPWGIQFNGEVRHETALYCLIANLILFIILYIIRKAKFYFDGLVVAVFMVYYGLIRFIIDIFRAQDLPLSDPRIVGLTPSQYISVIVFGLGIYLLFRRKKTTKN